METESALARRIRSGRGCEQRDGCRQVLTDCHSERKHASSSSFFLIAVTLAAHAANDFTYGNTCPREQQLAQLAFVVVVEEHLQLN